jgi:hypothetical protein
MLLLWIAPGDRIYSNDIFSLEYLGINYRAMGARGITKSWWNHSPALLETGSLSIGITRDL